ncbi:MAG TPA: hypothetical protein VEY93_01950 [Longimicrobium sp.]|nr:hypothetical protein [Longimicrobium sp.]
MSLAAAILLGTLVLWSVAFAPVHFGLLARGPDARSGTKPRVGFLAMLTGCLVLATASALLQLVRNAGTLREAVAVGILMAILPGAVLAGKGIRGGFLGSAAPRIVLLICGLVLCSVVIILVRR